MSHITIAALPRLDDAIGLLIRMLIISFCFLFFLTLDEYAQYYGQMNTMNGRMMTMKHQEGLPYEEMGYCPPPNRKLPPVPGVGNQMNSNYNTIDRIKNGKVHEKGNP